MPRIRPPLFWNENNENHLITSHNVSRDEVESILFDADGKSAGYVIFRRGNDVYEIFGETNNGKYLKLAGQFVPDGRFRVFAGRHMTDSEKRMYRKKKP